MNILDIAKEITSRDRNLQYGEPENNFQRIADYWNVYIKHKLEMDIIAKRGFKITPIDVAYMMSLMKQAREDYLHSKDSCTDICGYIRCASKIMGDENE